MVKSKYLQIYLKYILGYTSDIYPRVTFIKLLKMLFYYNLTDISLVLLSISPIKYRFS